MPSCHQHSTASYTQVTDALLNPPWFVGTLEMIRQCREQRMPEPEFATIRNKEFRAILPRDVLTQSVLEKMALNGRQVKAIRHVKLALRITNIDYQKLTGATRKTAARDLDNLVKRGLLVRKGTRRGAHYVIPARMVMRQQ